MAKVAVVGAGLMGTAVSWPLSDNGHSVNLVGTHLDADIISRCKKDGFHPLLKRSLPDNVRPYHVEQIAEALDGAEIIVSGVNSLGVHWVAGTIGPLLRPGQKIIAITKGLEYSAEEGVRILPDVLAGELDQSLRDRIPVAAVAGPCIAGELAGRRTSCVVFTSRDPQALRLLRGLFKTRYYNIWLSTDVVGVEMCAALKNAFTIAVGIAQGMLERAGGVDEAQAHMYNLAAALFGMAASEMFRLVALTGGDPQNVIGLPGVGDQYVTCVGGRTIGFGRLLGTGLRYSEAKAQMPGVTLEGTYVLQQLARAIPLWEAGGSLAPHELPLLRLLCRVVTEDMLADTLLEELLATSDHTG